MEDTLPEPLVLPTFRPITTLSLDTDIIHQYAGEVACAKLGTIRGVVIPTCEFMWSVLLFVRFGQTVGNAGLLLTLITIWICAVTMAVTVASISSIATNGVPRGGVYRILEKSLGSGVGGSIAILYLAGVTLLISVEIVGSIQGLLSWLEWPPLTGSPYWDQVVTSVVSLVLVLLIGSLPTQMVSKIAVVFLAVLFFAFASMIIGLALSGVVAGPDAAVQPSLDTLQGNLLPNWDDFSFSDTMAIILPCFIGLYSGVSNSHQLRHPAKSIPLGGFSSVALSTLLYSLLCSLFALCVPRNLLLTDILIGVRHAIPSPDFAVFGVLVVGLGASLQCLLTASAVLTSLLERRLLLPPCYNSLHSHQPVVVIALLASSMLILTDLEFLARLTALCFCLNYGSTNIACSLLSAFKSPIWRPQFKSDWRVSLLGTILCLFCMLTISTYAAFLSVLAASFLAYTILTSSANLAWGHGLHGLIFHVTLKYLIAAEQVRFRSQIDRWGLAPQIPPSPTTELSPVLIEQMPTPPYIDRMWRPQILVLLTKTNAVNGVPRYSQFLDFVSQLKTFSALCIAANVIGDDEMSELITQYTARQRFGRAIERIEMEQIILLERKLLLQQELRKHSIEGFVKVFTAPTVQIGQQVLLSTVGLGELTPNTVIMEWPELNGNRSHDSITGLLSIWQFTQRLGLSCLFCRGLSHFPHNMEVMVGTIDVWWLVEGGHLLLLIAYILQRHKVWNSCTIRLFAVCCTFVNIEQIHEELEMLVSLLRIQVECITVIPLHSLEAKAGTYGQTLRFNDQVISRCIAGELRREYRIDSSSSGCGENDSIRKNSFADSTIIPQILQAIQTESQHASLTVLNLPVPSASVNFTQTSIYAKLMDLLTEKPRRCLIYQVSEAFQFDETILS